MFNEVATNFMCTVTRKIVQEFKDGKRLYQVSKVVDKHIFEYSGKSIWSIDQMMKRFPNITKEKDNQYSLKLDKILRFCNSIDAVDYKWRIVKEITLEELNKYKNSDLCNYIIMSQDDNSLRIVNKSADIFLNIFIYVADDKKTFVVEPISVW